MKEEAAPVVEQTSANRPGWLVLQDREDDPMELDCPAEYDSEEEASRLDSPAECHYGLGLALCTCGLHGKKDQESDLRSGRSDQSDEDSGEVGDFVLLSFWERPKRWTRWAPIRENGTRVFKTELNFEEYDDALYRQFMRWVVTGTAVQCAKTDEWLETFKSVWNKRRDLWEDIGSEDPLVYARTMCEHGQLGMSFVLSNNSWHFEDDAVDMVEEFGVQLDIEVDQEGRLDFYEVPAVVHATNPDELVERIWTLSPSEPRWDEFVNKMEADMNIAARAAERMRQDYPQHGSQGAASYEVAWSLAKGRILGAHTRASVRWDATEKKKAIRDEDSRKLFFGMPKKLYLQVERAREVCAPDCWSAELLTELAHWHRQIDGEYKRDWVNLERYKRLRAVVCAERAPLARLPPLPQANRDMPDDIEVELSGEPLRAYQIHKQYMRGEDVTKQIASMTAKKYNAALRLAFRIARREGVLPGAVVEKQCGWKTMKRWMQMVHWACKGCRLADAPDETAIKDVFNGVQKLVDTAGKVGDAAAVMTEVVHTAVGAVGKGVSTAAGTIKYGAVATTEAMMRGVAMAKENAHAALAVLQTLEPVRKFKEAAEVVEVFVRAAVAYMSDSVILKTEALYNVMRITQKHGQALFAAVMAAVAKFLGWKKETEEEVLEPVDLDSEERQRRKQKEARNDIVRHLSFESKKAMLGNKELLKSFEGIDWVEPQHVPEEELTEANIDAALCFKAKAQLRPQGDDERSWFERLFAALRGIVVPHKDVEAKSFSQAITAANAVFTLGRNVRDLVTFLVECAQELVDLLAKYCFGVHVLKKKDEEDEVRKWMAETCEVIARYSDSDEVAKNPRMEDAAALLKQYYTLVPKMKAVPPEERVSARTLGLALDKLVDQHSFPEPDKAEAMWCMWYGDAGKGKTSCMQIVSDVMARFYGEKPITYRFGGEVFNDEYRGQRVVVCDELFTEKDAEVRAEVLASIMRHITVSKQPVNQAFTKSKQPFKGKYVMSSQNMDHFTEIGVTDVMAGIRRADAISVRIRPEAISSSGWKFPNESNDPDDVWELCFKHRGDLIRVDKGSSQKQHEEHLEKVAKVAGWTQPVVLAHKALYKVPGSWLSFTDFIRVLREAGRIRDSYAQENGRAADVIWNKLQEMQPVYRQVPQDDRSEVPLLAEVSKEQEERPSADGVRKRHGPLKGKTTKQNLYDELHNVVAGLLNNGWFAVDRAHRLRWLRDYGIGLEDARIQAYAGSRVLYEVWVGAAIPPGMRNLARNYPSRLIAEVLFYVLAALCGAFVGLAIGALANGAVMLMNKFRGEKEEPALEEQKYDEALARAVKRNIRVPAKLEKHLGAALDASVARIAQQTVHIFSKAPGEQGSHGVGLFVAQDVLLTARHIVQWGQTYTDALEVVTYNGQTYSLARNARQRDFEIVTPESDDVDVAFVKLTLAAVPVQGMRDLTGYFIPAGQLAGLRLTEAVMLKTKNGMATVQELAYPKFVSEPVVLRDEGRVERFADLVEYRSMTTKGDSGAVVCVDTSQVSGCILGVHSLGNSQDIGYATVVPREFVELVTKTAKVALEPQGAVWDFPLPEKCDRPEWLPSQVVCLGRFPPSWRASLPRKTKIVRAVYADSLPWTTDMVPAMLGPSDPIYPIREVAMRMTHDDRFDARAQWNWVEALNVARMVGRPVLTLESGHGPFITQKEAIVGIPGLVKSMDQSRSAGWPLNVSPETGRRKTKGEYAFVDGQVNDDMFFLHWLQMALASQAKGKAQPLVVAVTLKDETRPMTGALIEFETQKDMKRFERECGRHGILIVSEKDARALARKNGDELPEPKKEFFAWIARAKKTRGFYPVNVLEVMDEKVFLENFALALKRGRIMNGTFVGFTPNKRSDVELLVRHLSKAAGTSDPKLLKLICYDVKSNDLTCFSSYKKFIAHVVVLWYRMHYSIDEATEQLLYYRLYRLLFPLMCLDGYLCYYTNLFASGLFATFELGSVVNYYKANRFVQEAMHAKGVFVPLEKLMTEMPTVVGGDDTIIGVPEFVASVVVPGDVLAAAKRLGFGITSASFNKIELGAEYHSWKTAMVLKRGFRFDGNMIYMPLAKESLLGNLAWQREKGDPILLGESAMGSAIKEAFLHGEEFYNEVSMQLVRVAAKHHIPLCVPAFADLLADYKA